MDKYLEEKKENMIKAGFIIDKYDFIFRVKDIINENYDTTLNVFKEITKEVYYRDNSYNYCAFFKTIGLKDLDDNIIFKIKELSYIDKKSLNDRYSKFFYDGNECFDRDINFYYITNGMRELIKKYPLLKEYFLKLDTSYRDLSFEYIDNLESIDSKKVKELIKS